VISLIVQLLIAFPKIGALLFKLKREYVKELVIRRDNEHRNNITEWVRDAKREQDSRVPPKTEQPRV
jgi:hypothetical protein